MRLKLFVVFSLSLIVIFFNLVSALYSDPIQDIQKQWSIYPTSPSTHYDKIDEGTRQPNTPNKQDYIYGVGNIKDIFRIEGSGYVTRIRVWVYGENNGAGATIVVEIGDGTGWTSLGAFQLSSARWYYLDFEVNRNLNNLYISIEPTPFSPGAVTKIYALYAAITIPNQEVCDGRDNDNDGLIDEGFDNDNDGYTSCGGDCDDNNTEINPGVVDLCNGIDNNCNNRIDDNCNLITNAYLRVDLVNLNRFVNADRYREFVSIEGKSYERATEKDELLCEVSVTFPDYYTYNSPPENHYIWVSFNHSKNPRMGSLTRNLKHDCLWNNELKASYCNIYYFLDERDKSATISCIAQPYVRDLSEESPLGDMAESNETVVATYIYYFVPIYQDYGIPIIPDYGNINEQYDYYTNISEVNDRIDLVGKKILLGLVFLDIEEGEFCAGYFSVAKKSKEIKNLVKQYLGEYYISDSIITATTQKIYMEESQTGCTSLSKNAIVFVSIDSEDKYTLAHELGHNIGRLCDEYDIKYWKRENREQIWVRMPLFSGCPNPIREDRTIDFPECCMKKSDCYLHNGICLNNDFGLDELDYSCAPFPFEFKCYQPECYTNSECVSKGKCYCDEVTQKCMSCNEGTECKTVGLLVIGPNQFDIINRCVNERIQTVCSETDFSCYLSQQDGRCVACTIRGYKCMGEEGSKNCDMPQEELIKLFQGSCGNLNRCLGMPYLDVFGKQPDDIEPLIPITHHSIMGIDVIPINTYPENSICPLKNC